MIQIYLTFNSNGICTGAGATPDGTIPANAVVANAAQVVLWQGSTVANGVITSGSPLTPSPAANAACALASGVALTSTSNPALDGTYGVATGDQISLLGELMNLSVNSTFTNGTTSLGYADLSGAVHTFDPVSFKAFASAVGAYVGSLKIIAATNAGTLPASTIGIA